MVSVVVSMRDECAAASSTWLWIVKNNGRYIMALGTLAMLPRASLARAHGERELGGVDEGVLLRARG